MKTYEQRQAEILATMTDKQRKAFESGAELIIHMGKVFVRGIDRWPLPRSKKGK